ncbi:MAG: hypothetical protein QUV06_04585 [Cyanobium sp. CZS 48M]|nr:hypothetical protein [Cyanobium sp. CZS48M]
MSGETYANQYVDKRLLVAGRALERHQRTGLAQQLVLCQLFDARTRAIRTERGPATDPAAVASALARTKVLRLEQAEHRPLLEILSELRAIVQEILQGFEELEGMLR